MTDVASTPVAVTRVDFSADKDTAPLLVQARLRAEGITVVRCRAIPNPGGGRLVSPQAVVAVPLGPSFDLEWRAPGSERVRATTISRGRLVFYPAGAAVWARWQGSPSILAMALAPAFIEAVHRRASASTHGPDLPLLIGVDDPLVHDVMQLAERELSDAGARGGVFLEGLGTALTVHLLRTYGGRKPVRAKPGALAPGTLTRVSEFIAAHLTEVLTVAHLAAVVGLKPRHFGAAFKAATGEPPHRYVVRCRVERAREFLRDPGLTLAQVAMATGFSSQSHFTAHFRRLTGMTPARFRRTLS